MARIALISCLSRPAVATAEAKVLSTELSVYADSKLFELAGIRSTLAAEGLDRIDAMRAPIRCMTPCAGNTPFWAITL